MGTINCWEFKKCGRDPSGGRARELGVCPAATYTLANGMNGGTNGGRICWAIAGTLCGGETRGTFAAKEQACAGCDFFRLVQHDSGPAFHLLLPGQIENRALLDHFTTIVSIVDSLNAVVYVADIQTHELLFINPYAARLFGPDCVGKPCYKALQAGQEGRCPFCTNHLLVVDGTPAPPVVWEFQNTITKRWFLCIDKAIPWWDGRLVRMEIAVDISDRKEAERFREEYLALVSHDLRNPLNALMLRAQGLRISFEKNGREREQAEIDRILASARQMNALIEDLIETSRIDAGRLELKRVTLDLGNRISQVVARIASPAESTRVSLRRDGEMVKVLADPVRIDRVVANLLSNALKYSREAPVAIAVERWGQEAVVSFVDRGVGMAAEELPRIFQRFYRAASSAGFQGVGLGLFNARMIVEAHGGRIWAESEAGHGATFRFALPLAGPEA